MPDLALSWPSTVRQDPIHARNVTTPDFETLYFQTCRTLNGHAESVSIGKRNGHAVLLLPRHFDGLQAPAPDDWSGNQKYYVNLNDVEVRTWRRLLDGWTLSELARDEHVSPAAIRARIQGNSKGQGGMIAKNFWVLLWWNVRRKSHNR